ncbi:MAG: hypothetical protein ACKVQJ_12890 [Pyrinomonadaceae bacterium]
MRDWSDTSIHQDFVLKVFCDTNVLVYLVDHTYERLNDLIKLMGESPFLRVVSSEFALFEFVGVRKREHFLRSVVEHPNENADYKLNYLGLMKGLDQFKTIDPTFDEVVEPLRDAVNKEVNQIFEEWDIDFRYSPLNNKQIEPANEICLNSKIANFDSLILVSAVITESADPERHVLLLTNDGSFKSHSESPGLKACYENRGINVQFANVSNLSFGNVDGLKVEKDMDTDLREFLKNEIRSSMTSRLKHLLVGTTFIPRNNSVPKNIICLRLAKDSVVRNGMYLTIVGHDLDFLYTTRKKIDSFQSRGVEVADGQAFDGEERPQISFLLQDVDDDGNVLELNNEILDAFRNEGNLVFIHPDSSIGD